MATRDRIIRSKGNVKIFSHINFFYSKPVDEDAPRHSVLFFFLIKVIKYQIYDVYSCVGLLAFSAGYIWCYMCLLIMQMAQNE